MSPLMGVLSRKSHKMGIFLQAACRKMPINTGEAIRVEKMNRDPYR